MKPLSKIVTGFLLMVSTFQLMAQSININIVNIRNCKGNIYLAVYRDAISFKEDKPFMAKKYNKKLVKNGELSVDICLEPGTYGMAVLDDENGDDKMKYSVLGIPQEGFGFSDLYLDRLIKPQFSDFDFVFTDSTKNVLIRLKYM